MKIDRFLQLFVVKEKKFYPLYIRHAEFIYKAADLLVNLLQEQDIDRRKQLYKNIKEYEHQGDLIATTIYEELNKTFVTPFDREDINLLATRMDSFLDFIHDSAKRVVMYRPNNINETLIVIGQHILKDAALIKAIMESLESVQKNPEPINLKCMELKAIEQKVDDLYENFMSDLFANEKDAIELTKLKNIVQVLEDATDRAKHTGDVVRGIIIKFA